MGTDALGYTKNDIILGPGDEGDIADLVLGELGLVVDPMGIDSASLRKDGDEFIASVDVYDDETYEIRVTREQVLEALDWDNI